MNVSRFAPPILVAVLLFGAASCAQRAKRPPGVPIDQRPTPVQPPPEAAKPAPSNGSSSRPSAGGNATAEEQKIASVMSPEERRQAIVRVVADTTAAAAAVKKCATRKLLPDQESVFETTQSLLAQTRAALGRDEVWRAESLARKARQLASSLDCP
jgi:hypothetical protein